MPHINRFQCLNSFLSAINEETLQVICSIFTWKKRVHTHLVYKRLDRKIVKNDWGNLYPNAYELHVLIIILLLFRPMFNMIGVRHSHFGFRIFGVNTKMLTS